MRAPALVNTLSDEGRRFTVLFRQRLRDRRFWIVQGLVLGITGVHGALEATEVLGRHEALSFVPVSLYLIPVLYAALNFGIEGALPTALWSILLATPNAFVWHEGVQRVGEFFQAAVMLTVAILVAQRVDKEAQAKETAEQVSRRLAQLNATAAAASQFLEPRRVVGETLDVILKQGNVDTVWIAFAPGNLELPPLAVLSRLPTQPASLSGAWEEITRRVIEDGQPRLEGNAVVVPIRAAGKMIGALGAACHESSSSADDLTLLDGMAHQLAVALDNSRHYQEAKRALDELAHAQENLRTYLRLATEAQEEERKRLARELHDDTIQSLVVIKANLDTLAAGKRLPATARARLDVVERMVEAAVSDVRRFSQDLRPSLLDDLGLVHAIDWLLADMGRRTGVQGRLHVEGESRRLRADAEVAVYRIVQEALRNVEKHSGATTVEVTLAFGPDGLVVQVADSGCGFASDQVLGQYSNGRGMGLLGMQERAKLVGGSLSIESQPGQGTQVTVMVDSAAA